MYPLHYLGFYPSLSLQPYMYIRIRREHLALSRLSPLPSVTYGCQLSFILRMEVVEAYS